MALYNLPGSVVPYSLATTYDNTNLFTEFNFFTDNDPTHGYVDYLSFADSSANFLIEQLSGGVARIKVDFTSIPDDAARGRKSVRLESNTVYNHGLFLADVAHMPSSTCGLWPALWQVGPNWFRDGEVDIVEGVHEATTNLISLHTDGSEGICSLVPDEQNGLVGSAQCDNALTSAGGCGVSNGPFGTPFNNNGGGVYAMEWLSSGIKIWFFSRDQIPVDITSGIPNPSSWSAPVLQVGSNCDIDAHFRNMRIVIDTTFCGDWAGNSEVWEQTSCYKANPVASNTCVDYVKNHPEAYADGYWDINSIKVFNQAANLEPEPEQEPGLNTDPAEVAPSEDIPSDEPAMEVPNEESTLDLSTSLQPDEESTITLDPLTDNISSIDQVGDGGCPAHYPTHSLDHGESAGAGSQRPCPRCSDASQLFDVKTASGSTDYLPPDNTLGASKVVPAYGQVETGNPVVEYIESSLGSRTRDHKTVTTAVVGALILAFCQLCGLV